MNEREDIVNARAGIVNARAVIMNASDLCCVFLLFDNM